MAVENPPRQETLEQAFEHEIYTSDGKSVQFGSLFVSVQAHQSVLVIFIRHFFCGNCQEYVRRLSCPESPFHPTKPAAQRPTLIIIGPGSPSLISSYLTLTECPFAIYADPSTRLYDILGMHRTLSMGPKKPEYIQHSIFGNAVKSAWQILRRVGNGDANSGGNLDVNGGEFLFVHRNATKNGRCSSSPDSVANPARNTASAGSACSNSTIQWRASWCHRMLNSRDHTELSDLENHVLATSSHPGGARTTSPPRPILARGSPYTAVPRSYASHCRGSCPGPDIPKCRDEALMKQHLQKVMSTPHQQTRSPSRSSGGLKRPHSRARSTASGSESRACPPPPPIQEQVEHEEEMQQAKGLTKSVASRVGQIVRSKSFSAKSSKRVVTASDGPGGEIPRTMHTRKRSVPNLFRLASRESPSMPQRPPSASASAAASHARSESTPQARVGSHSRSPSNLVPTSKQSKDQARMPLISRTLSFSAPRPLSRKGKGKGHVEMDDNGVMLVDGVEFVNVISLRARVDSGFGEEKKRGHRQTGSGESRTLVGEQHGEKQRLTIEGSVAA